MLSSRITFTLLCVLAFLAVWYADCAPAPQYNPWTLLFGSGGGARGTGPSDPSAVHHIFWGWR
ncbi:hypothetical protein AAVH_29487 [Aphelenchoides avenae]|nr:hypothetical protein AAVH_29487 [Aphelenchus avenae]